MKSLLRLPLPTLLITLAALCGGRALQAADVNGRWKSEFEIQDWHLKYVYELKSDGDKLVGKAFRDRDGEKASAPIQEGKINGDEISFVEIIHAGDQDLRVEYKGKISGDKINFTRKVGDYGSRDIVAMREKEGDAVSGLEGKWQSEFDSRVGHQKYVYEFKLDGETLTGKATREVDDQKTVTEIKGKFSGGEISFTEPLKTQDREITIDYTGRISGGELKLTRKVGDFATTEITAKRMKAQKD